MALGSTRWSALGQLAMGGAAALGVSACSSIQGLSGDEGAPPSGSGGGTVILGDGGSGGDPGAPIHPPASGGPPVTDDAGGTQAGPRPTTPGADASAPSPDAGCAAASFSVGAPAETGALLGGDSGAPFSEACPPGAAIVGLNLVSDPSSPYALYQVQALCSAITLGPCGAGLAFAAPQPLASEGTQPGTPDTVACPAGSVAVGLSVTANKYVHAVSLACAPLTLAPSGLAVALGATTTEGPAGGSGNEPLLTYACPAGQVGSGLSGAAGGNDFVDAIALGCGTPSVK